MTIDNSFIFFGFADKGDHRHSSSENQQEPFALVSLDFGPANWGRTEDASRHSEKDIKTEGHKEEEGDNDVEVVVMDEGMPSPLREQLLHSPVGQDEFCRLQQSLRSFERLRPNESLYPLGRLFVPNSTIAGNQEAFSLVVREECPDGLDEFIWPVSKAAFV